MVAPVRTSLVMFAVLLLAAPLLATGTLAYHDDAPGGADAPLAATYGTTYATTAIQDEGSAWYAFPAAPDGHYAVITGTLETQGRLLLYSQTADGNPGVDFLWYESPWQEAEDTVDFERPLYVSTHGGPFQLAFQLFDAPTNNVTFTVETVPAPDIALTDIQVEHVPIVTDHGTLPTSTRRAITITIENQGAGDADHTDVHVLVYGATFGTDRIGHDVTRLDAGETTTLTFTWDGSRSVGDIEIVAYAWTPMDLDWSDDSAAARDWVHAGNLGYGFVH